MVYEGTVTSTSNIALEALVWSYMTEVQLPQITQQKQNVEECKHVKPFSVLKREKDFNS